MRPELTNALVLAYLGDAYLELLVRDHLIRHTDIAKPNDYQKAAVLLVSAKGQMEFMKVALKESWFSKEEEDIYKRGRNTKSGTKNETVAHSYSTGFEAIIGHYYLLEEMDRIDEIFQQYLAFFEKNKEQ
ncbi:Mini-ribonuclease 3 [Tannockella kyphosi]|uniref:Mini-ribonuclease 3 n=1 Tax=Tannockella kyphosi TaxID=2899121 RepID=UPI002011D902|nr:ribonuclease III domain-containing protein [Tannockella kyphosi]